MEKGQHSIVPGEARRYHKAQRKSHKIEKIKESLEVASGGNSRWLELEMDTLRQGAVASRAGRDYHAD